MVGISVLFTLLLFWSYLKLRLGIVGLRPKEKNIILPVGPAFLFDRLLPAYQIRQDHYNIQAFYKKAPKKSLLLNTKNMRRFWGLSTIKVVEATADEAQRAEKSLDVLKALGLALAIFLVAAINAIVLH